MAEPWSSKTQWMLPVVPPTRNVTWGTRLEPHWSLVLASEDVRAPVAEAAVVPPESRPGGLQTTVAEATDVAPGPRPEPQNQKLKWVSAYVPPTWNVAWRTRLEPHAESNLASEDMQAAEAEVPMVAPGPRPAFSPAPYMTTTLGQQLTALPSMVLHEAFALSNPCLDQTPLPCSSMEYHPPETQVPEENFGLQNVGQEEEPVASDQATVSATVECEEILQAAAALMTLKNSSWIWR
ncbi:hypothetical protein ACRRTK_002374 [Alexandromys fortis]